MKLPWLYLVFLALIEGLAGCGSSKLAPQAPTASYQAPPRRVPEATTLTLPIEVSVAYLEKMLNQQLPEPLYQDMSLDDNGGDNLMLRVQRRAPARLTASGNVFDVRVPIKVWAKAGYRVDKFGLTIGKYEETDFELDIRFLSAVSTTQDWKLVLKTTSNGYDWVKKPTVSLAGFQIPITSIVERILDQQQAQIAEVIDEQVRRNFDLRTQALQAWKLMQEPVQINEVYRAWLVLSPIEVSAGPLLAQAGKLKLAIGIRALAETHLGEKPLIAPNGTLPPLRQVARPEEGFAVDLLTRVPWVEAKRLALAQLQGQTFTFQEGKRQVKVEDLEIYGKDGKMVVGAQLSGSVTGKVYLTGIPVYDPASQAVSLSSADFDLQTKNRVLRSADWLLHGQFVKKMQPYLTYPLAAQLTEAKALLAQNLAGNRLRSDVTVTGKLDRLTPDGLYVAPEGLMISIKAAGKLELRVSDE